jgi:hypothetical protein
MIGIYSKLIVNFIDAVGVAKWIYINVSARSDGVAIIFTGVTLWMCCQNNQPPAATELSLKLLLAASSSLLLSSNLTVSDRSFPHSSRSKSEYVC